MKYELNQEVNHYGSLYTVTRLYTLTDAEMKAYDLACRNRVTITKVSGTYGLPTYDFAVTD